MSDFGKYVNRLPPGTDPALARALADVFRDIVEDKKPAEDKLDLFVTPQDYGARGDGVTDDTAAFVAALAASDYVYVPPGTYICDEFEVANNKTLVGSGVTSVIKATGTFADDAYIYVTGDDVRIGNLKVSVASTYTTVNAFYVDAAARVYIHDVTVDDCGARGIYTINCTDCTFERVRVVGPLTRGIEVYGTAQANNQRNKVIQCRVTDAGTDHGIQFNNGTDMEASRNIVSGSTIFGINMLDVARGVIRHNVCYDTIKEGINIQDSANVVIDGNLVYWTGSASTDFGISLWGESGAGGSANFNIVVNNQVANSGKSGIALDDACGFNRIAHNTITNANQLNEASGAGIILYGSNCQDNYVEFNSVYESGTNTKYGVYEWNSGGAANNNYIIGNRINGVATADISRSSGTIESLNFDGWSSYTPTVTAGAGTFTTVSATGKWFELQKIVFVQAVITITTNGTAATDVRFTLPITASGNVAVLNGRETGTGASLSATIGASATLAVVRKYDNTYPGGTGYVLEVNGFYERV